MPLTRWPPPCPLCCHRHLLVSNTSNALDASDRLRFYAVNLEHAMAESNGEIRHASHVDIFGLKKEGIAVGGTVVLLHPLLYSC